MNSLYRKMNFLYGEINLASQACQKCGILYLENSFLYIENSFFYIKRNQISK